jgi:hypothetical protein
MNLITASILVTNIQLVKITCNVICHAGISILIDIYSIGCSGRCCSLLLTRKGTVKPLETLLDGMPFVPTQLALKIAVRIRVVVVVLLTAIATAEVTTATTTVVTTSMTTSSCRVGFMILTCLLKFLALLMCQELPIELGHGNRLDPGGHHRDHTIKLIVKACQNIQDQFLIIQSLPSGCHLIYKSFHLGDILAYHHVTLLGCGESYAHVNDMSARLRLEAGHNVCPIFFRGVVRHRLQQHLVRK